MIAAAQLEKIYSKETGTVNDVIKPLVRGKGYFVDQLPIVKSSGLGVDLIPGDPKFSLAEDFLSKDWVDATAGIYRGLQTTFFVRHLLSRCGDYDYVFLDVGPSLGAITRAVLTASEFFIIPMSSDIFSIRGLQDIEISVRNWANELQQGLERYKSREMHGSVSKPNDLIFTRTDHAKARSKHRSFYSLIESLLRTHTLLFIGCGLSDPDIRLLLEDYSFSFEHARKNYFTIPASDLGPIAEQTIGSALGLEFLRYSSKNFHKELSESFADLQLTVDLKRAEMADSQSW